MTSKQPQPPPPKPPLTSYKQAELILQSAIQWRNFELQNSDAADYALYTLKQRVDDLREQITNPPTSVPPPKKR